jgi:hypothetical protein
MVPPFDIMPQFFDLAPALHLIQAFSNATIYIFVI